MADTLLAHYLTQLRRSIVTMEHAETAYQEVIARYAGTTECPAMDQVAAQNDPGLRSAIALHEFYARRVQAYSSAALVELAVRAAGTERRHRVVAA